MAASFLCSGIYYCSSFRWLPNFPRARPNKQDPLAKLRAQTAMAGSQEVCWFTWNAMRLQSRPERKGKGA
jgi:hypothetical protein